MIEILKSEPAMADIPVIFLTADRKGRAVRVERVVHANPKQAVVSDEAGASRNGRRFAAERNPRPEGERTFKPREDRAGGDKPFRKPREDGERSFKPRAEGERTFKPREDRAGGDKPFRKPREGGPGGGDKPFRKPGGAGRPGGAGGRPGGPGRPGGAGGHPGGRPTGGKPGGRPSGDKPRGPRKER